MKRVFTVLSVALLFMMWTSLMMGQTPTTWGFESGATGGWTTLNVTNGGADVAVGTTAISGEMSLRSDFNTPAVLAVGDSFRVTGSFVSDGNLGGQALRFGVFNNKGAGGTATGTPSTWTAGGANSYSGYLFIAPSGGSGNPNWNGGGGTGSMGFFLSSKTNAWLSTTGGYSLGGPVTAENANAATYDFVMGFKRLATNQMRVTLSLTRQGGGYTLAGTVVDDGTNNGGVISTSTFTSIGFRFASASGSAMSNLTFTNVVGTFTPLPVELTSFNAAVRGKNVELAWHTAAELNNHGFEVEKNTNGTWAKIGFVAGNGTTNKPNAYSYVDRNVSGKVSYRLKQVDNDGKFEYTEAVSATVVGSFALKQNYPNPFNPASQVSFDIPEQSNVRIVLVNMLGEVVKEVVNQNYAAGSHEVTIDGSNLSSGVYFYRLDAGSFTATKKLLLMK